MNNQYHSLNLSNCAKLENLAATAAAMQYTPTTHIQYGQPPTFPAMQPQPVRNLYSSQSIYNPVNQDRTSRTYGDPTLVFQPSSNTALHALGLRYSNENHQVPYNHSSGHGFHQTNLGAALGLHPAPPTNCAPQNLTSATRIVDVNGQYNISIVQPQNHTPPIPPASNANKPVQHTIRVNSVNAAQSNHMSNTSTIDDKSIAMTNMNDKMGDSRNIVTVNNKMNNTTSTKMNNSTAVVNTKMNDPLAINVKVNDAMNAIVNSISGNADQKNIELIVQDVSDKSQEQIEVEEAKVISQYCVYCDQEVVMTEKDFEKHKAEHLHKKKTQLKLATKIEIIKRIEAGEGKPDLAEEYKVHISTIKGCWRNQKKYWKEWKLGKCDPNSVRIKAPKLGDLEEMLYVWYTQAKENNVPVSGPILRTKAIDFARKLGHGEFKPSNGWLDRFKKRKRFTLQRKTKQMRLEESNRHTENIPKILMDNDVNNVFALDFVGLFYHANPDYIRSKNFLCAGGIEAENRLSIALFCNMTGTEKLPPLVVGTTSESEVNSNETIARYVSEEHAWFTREIIQAWLLDLDSYVKRQKRNVVILTPPWNIFEKITDLTSLRIVQLPPTQALPLRQMVLPSFKKFYRKFFLLEFQNVVMSKKTESMELLQSKQPDITSPHSKENDGALAKEDTPNDDSKDPDYVEEKSPGDEKVDLTPNEPEYKVPFMNILQMIVNAWEHIPNTVIMSSFQRAGLVKFSVWEVAIPNATDFVQMNDVLRNLAQIMGPEYLSTNFEEFSCFDDNLQVCNMMSDEDIISIVKTNLAKEEEFVKPVIRRYKKADKKDKIYKPIKDKKIRKKKFKIKDKDKKLKKRGRKKGKKVGRKKGVSGQEFFSKLEKSAVNFFGKTETEKEEFLNVKSFEIEKALMGLRKYIQYQDNAQEMFGILANLEYFLYRA